MMKRQLKICRTCERIFMETGTLNKHKILHKDKKAQNFRTCGKLFMETGTLNKHEILHNKEKAQNLQDM